MITITSRYIARKQTIFEFSRACNVYGDVWFLWWWKAVRITLSYRMGSPSRPFWAWAISCHLLLCDFCDRCCVWQTLPAHACHARSIADVYTGCQNLFFSRNDSDGACLLVCVVLRSACSAMLESNVYAGAQSFFNVKQWCKLLLSTILCPWLIVSWSLWHHDSLCVRREWMAAWVHKSLSDNKAQGKIKLNMLACFFAFSSLVPMAPARQRQCVTFVSWNQSRCQSTGIVVMRKYNNNE